MIEDSPCRYCPVHTPNCHSQCEKYIKWARNRRQLSKKATEIKQILFGQSDGAVAFIRRQKKKQRKF